MSWTSLFAGVLEDQGYPILVQCWVTWIWYLSQVMILVLSLVIVPFKVLVPVLVLVTVLF